MGIIKKKISIKKHPKMLISNQLNNAHQPMQPRTPNNANI